MSFQLARNEADDARIAHFEKEENFRWLSSLLATTSSVTLNRSHLVPESVEESINALAEFAEIAHGSIDPAWVLQAKNRKLLGANGFPLQDYPILSREIDGQIEPIELVEKFYGTNGGLQGYCALRLQPRTSAAERLESSKPNGPGTFRPQIIVAFSGTSNLRLALYDVMVAPSSYKTASSHPSKSTWSVHDGFQRVYQGIKAQACRALADAIEVMTNKHRELSSDGWDLVITAHSLGAAVSYLFLLDLMHRVDPTGSISGDQISLDQDVPIVPESTNITMALFGSPRVANTFLVAHFHALSKAFRKKRGRPEALTDWSIIGHMDGVPALPPAFFGYVHFCQQPLYSFGGHLYRVPPCESEHANFKVDVPPDINILYPRGGHNYYAARDMERLQRRMKWIMADVLSSSKAESNSKSKSKSHSGSKSASKLGSGSGAGPTPISGSGLGSGSTPQSASSKRKLPSIQSIRSFSSRHRSGSRSKSGFAEAESPTYPSDPQTMMRRNLKRASWSVSGSSSAPATASKTSQPKSNSSEDGNPRGMSILSPENQTLSPEDQEPLPPPPANQTITDSPKEEKIEFILANVPSTSKSPETTTTTIPEWMEKYLEREKEEENIWQRKLNTSGLWTGLRSKITF